MKLIDRNCLVWEGWEECSSLRKTFWWYDILKCDFRWLDGCPRAYKATGMLLQPGKGLLLGAALLLAGVTSPKQ